MANEKTIEQLLVKEIPFAFLPYRINKSIAKRFHFITHELKKLFPLLETRLKNARIVFSAEEYLSLALFYFFAYFLLFLTIFLIAYFTLTNAQDKTLLFYVITASFLLALLFLLQIMLFPSIMQKKIERSIDSNLSYALRHMIILLSAGLSLFETMRVIASKNFGYLSNEFRQIVEYMQAGIKQDVAIERIALTTPSESLRKVLWQIINSLKTGSEIKDVIRHATETVTKKQIIEIKEYGNSLRVYSLVFVVIGIIFPVLATTLLTLASGFPLFEITRQQLIYFVVFYAILVFLYLGLLKFKRPVVIS